MSYVTHKLELYKRLGDGEGSWETIPRVIDNFFGKLIRKGSGSTKDTFKFNILNNYNKFYNTGSVFEKGDRIKIYQVKNDTIFTVDDMLIDGVISSILNTNNVNKVLTINGKSRTEQLLEGVTFVTYTTEQNPSTILREALNFHNRNNKNFKITWKSTNPTLKSDGISAFPTYLVEDFYKPMFQLFEKYSSNEYTKDGQYYYYVNDNNELVWDKKLKQTSGTLSESQCEVVTINDNSDTVINSIVINCGTSPNGNKIRAYYYDHASRAKNGAKWKYFTKTNNIITDLLVAERLQNPSSFDNSNAIFPNSYPYTSRWGVTSNSDGDWNDSVKEQAKLNGLEYGKSYADGVNQGRLKVTSQISFTKEYNLMDVLSCTFPSHGVSGMPLRITDIQYTDYNTILTLLQDIEE